MREAFATPSRPFPNERSHARRVAAGSGKKDATDATNARRRLGIVENGNEYPFPSPSLSSRYSSKNGATCSANTAPRLTRSSAETARHRLCSMSSLGSPRPNTNAKTDSTKVISFELFDVAPLWKS
jgi:hypothetical protein